MGDGKWGMSTGGERSVRSAKAVVFLQTGLSTDGRIPQGSPITDTRRNARPTASLTCRQGERIGASLMYRTFSSKGWYWRGHTRQLQSVSAACCLSRIGRDAAAAGGRNGTNPEPVPQDW